MNLKRLNIILYDDDKDDCTFFKQALVELPLPSQLTILYDGEELMQHLIHEATELPHMLSLDINMPRKNGIEFFPEIKNFKTFR